MAGVGVGLVLSLRFIVMVFYILLKTFCLAYKSCKNPGQVNKRRDGALSWTCFGLPFCNIKSGDGNERRILRLFE